MKYIFTPRALKDVQKLGKKDQERIILKLDFYTKQKDIYQFCEPLINTALGSYRFRIGDFRVIFDPIGEEIVILRIGHRKEIYR